MGSFELAGQGTPVALLHAGICDARMSTRQRPSARALLDVLLPFLDRVGSPPSGGG